MQREIRDPIHRFVHLDTGECRVLDSAPFQRLRHIHQLATTFLVYPGATHRRFEHSLGVMELAGRVYDVVTRPDNLRAETQAQVRPLVEELDEHERTYWRRALRLAALCHDVGHLPFSHAAEDELLPEGVDHESLTLALIRSDHLAPIFGDLKIQVEDVAKLAVGAKKYRDADGARAALTAWEALLAEIVVGDFFGVDRMDYLLRDSHHAGVGYGQFDHDRLIDCLRILPQGPEEPATPAIGVEEGGLPSALAMAYARYFMYLQVYFHRVRRAYDIHLKDFLRDDLPGGRFSTDVDDHLAMTDNEVTVALRRAARDPGAAGHEHARRLVERSHFRVLYEKTPEAAVRRDAGAEIYRAARDHFGAAAVRHDRYRSKRPAAEFPVLRKRGPVVLAEKAMPEFLDLPVLDIERVFVDPSLHEDALQWLDDAFDGLVAPMTTEEE